MKTRIQILATSLVLISIMTSLSAQAGILDWFRTNGASAELASGGSFDSLYASVLDTSVPDNEDLAFMAHAMAPMNSPVGGTQKTIRRTYTVQVSGYNSEVAQCDDSPFITAKGTHVRDGIVATNMFPFGTIIKIPSLYGNKIFVVEDRMNKRYQKNVDIWFADKTEALQLGRRMVQIEVIM